ncbi:MAG: hypothetical protein RLZZ516_478 [Cyanobacteriota bacterium]|jgi:hypothetical protein
MGFDPRQWPSAAQPRRVTTNIDALLAENQALLAENQALRREVQQLRRLLEQWDRQSRPDPGAQRQGSQSQGSARVTAEQVQQWGDALAAQTGWRELRLGDPHTGTGLRGLIETLNRRSFFPQLTLEQRLDRLVPGLGGDLQQALAGPDNRRRLAIRAAFALYGVSALEWLDDDPNRVVADLRARQRSESGRRTSSDHRSQRSSQGSDSRGRNTTGSSGGQQHQQAADAPAGADPRRVEAYRLLGLPWGAPTEAIKRAHRRLVKQHHPDLGGRAEDFHRISQAYQLLVA